jgi:hypothetical protein
MSCLQGYFFVFPGDDALLPGLGLRLPGRLPLPDGLGERLVPGPGAAGDGFRSRPGDLLRPPSLLWEYLQPAPLVHLPLMKSVHILSEDRTRLPVLLRLTVRPPGDKVVDLLRAPPFGDLNDRLLRDPFELLLPLDLE